MPIGGPSHIGGIVSGMDTESMIADMMKIEQLKLDRVYRNKTTQEWKLEAYADVNKKMKEFREKYFSVLSPNNVLTSGSYNSFDITTTPNTAIKIGASGSVVARKLEIYGVTKATSATVTSGPNFSSNRVEKAGDKNLLQTTITGEKTEIDDPNKKIGDFTDANGKNIFGLNGVVKEGIFEINGKAVKFDKDTTVQALMDKVNNDPDIKAKMSLNNGKFTITADKLGADTTLKIENKAGTAFGASGGFGINQGTYNYANSTPPAGVSVTSGSQTLFETGATKTTEAMDFTINGKNFTFEKGTALSDIMKQVNISGVGVKMTLADKKITLESIRTGSNSGINITDTTGTAFGPSGEFGINAGQINPTSDNKPFVNSTTKLDGLDGFVAQDTTVKINGKTIDLKLDANSTVQDLIDQVENGMKDAAGNKTVLMRFDERTGSFTLRSNVVGETKMTVEDAGGKLFGEDSLTGISTAADDFGSVQGIKLTDTLAMVAFKATGQSIGSDTNGYFSFEVNGKTLNFSADTTLKDMLQAVNGTDSKVQMSYSQINDGFTISDKTTGEKSSVTIGGKGFELLGLGKGTTGGSPTGKDAQIELSLDGGPKKTIKQSTNNFTMDGITFNIQADFDGTPQVNGVNTTIVSDFVYNTDNVVKKVKDFITDYNALIDDLSGLLTEKKGKNDRQYIPLSPTEREGMTEKEIEQWEKKAKIGILRNDSNINNLLTNLRTAVYSVVGGTGKSPSSLGITTRSWTAEGGTAYGQLELSAEGEKKLRQALNDNPDVVQQVFAGVSFSADPTQKTAESGMFTRMSNMMNSFTNELRNTKIKSTTKQIEDHDKTISTMIRKMAEKEQRYWDKFTRMEKALSQLNAQSGYFSSMLGG